MNSNLNYLIASLFLVTGCVSTSNTAVNQSGKRSIPEIVFSIDDNNDGVYEIIELEKEQRPEPTQGKDKWAKDFHGSINYPAIAKENGTQGVVILDIEVDQNGKVRNVNIKKGVSAACDKEAKRAHLASIQGGYVPFLRNYQAVKFKMEMPVGFWLE